MSPLEKIELAIKINENLMKMNEVHLADLAATKALLGDVCAVLPNAKKEAKDA